MSAPAASCGSPCRPGQPHRSRRRLAALGISAGAEGRSRVPRTRRGRAAWRVDVTQGRQPERRRYGDRLRARGPSDRGVRSASPAARFGERGIDADSALRCAGDRRLAESRQTGHLVGVPAPRRGRRPRPGVAFRAARSPVIRVRLTMNPPRDDDGTLVALARPAGGPNVRGATGHKTHRSTLCFRPRTVQRARTTSLCAPT